MSSDEHAYSRILVADDEESFRAYLGDMLEADGYTVDQAAGGEEAVELLGKHRYDAVICDIVMPDITGFDVLEKAQHMHPGLDVLMITAFATVEHAVEALNRGASQLFVKPIDMEDVRRRLEQVLQRRRNRRRISGELVPVMHWTIPSHVDYTEGLIDQVVERAREFGYGPRWQMSLRHCLDEALLNAIEHGNYGLTRGEENYRELVTSRREDPQYVDKAVDVRARISDEEVELVVQDEGDGFDTSKLPDPRDKKNLMKSHGRGVFIMRSMMDEVVYEDDGRRVIMRKRREQE